MHDYQANRCQTARCMVSYLLKIQTMIVKESCNVLLLHYVFMPFHTLDDIAFKCLRQ